MEEDSRYWNEELYDAIRDSSEAARKGFAIRERAFEFAVAATTMCDRIAASSFTGRELARQLFRSSSSVGANLEEADAAHSRADFASKCGIALREARESRYWLRLAERTGKADTGLLQEESRELVAILTTIVKKSRAS